MLHVILQKTVDCISKFLTGHVFHLLSILTKLHFITKEARNNKPSLHSSKLCFYSYFIMLI